MTQKPRSGSIVVWQEVPDGVPEPALLISPYTDIISIYQEDRYINLNYESLKGLAKIFKELEAENLNKNTKK